MQVNHIEFQFHIGSIKTLDELAASCAVTRFQFHIGSIKTDRVFKSLTEEGGFNSTLVRLRHIAHATKLGLRA